MKLFLLLPIILLAGCASMRSNVIGAKTQSFDGTKIFYDIRGCGDTALVFIHGWCCNRQQWDAQMDAFAKDHRVVAIDLGGHGESGRTRNKWSVTDYGQDVEAVVDAEGLDRVILVGHSMGGPVGLIAAARMPNRVIGVIGVDTLHDVSKKFDKQAMAPFLEALAKDFPAFLDKFIGQIRFTNPDVDPALIDRLTKDALANDPKMALGLMRSFTEFDTAQMLKACPAPVRCINAAGAHFPTNVEVNRQYSEFDAVEIENVGHWIMLEKPDEFNQLLKEQVATIETLP